MLSYHIASNFRGVNIVGKLTSTRIFPTLTGMHVMNSNEICIHENHHFRTERIFTPENYPLYGITHSDSDASPGC